MKIIATGTTGFLGHWVTQGLNSKGIPWKGISRGGEHGLAGNLTKWDLGLDLKSLKSEKFDTFLHMGAIYDLRARPADLLNTNLSGTRTALSVAKKLGIKHFVNLSSIAAVINTPHTDVGETESFLDQPFPDAYAESKAYGEELVEQWAPHFLSCLNLRLGILVGSMHSGEILRIDGPYHIPEAFRRLKKAIYLNPIPIPLPGSKSSEIPLVPVDCAGAAITSVVEKASGVSGFQTLHLVPQKPVSVTELYQDSLDFFGLGHKKFKLTGRLPLGGERKLASWIGKLPEEEVTYLMKMPKFHKHNASDLLEENWCPSYSIYKKSFWRGYEKFIQNR